MHIRLTSANEQFASLSFALIEARCSFAFAPTCSLSRSCIRLHTDSGKLNWLSFLFIGVPSKCQFVLSRRTRMWIDLYTCSRRRVALRSSRRRERPAGAHACLNTPRVRSVRVACKVEIRTTPYYVVLAKWAGTDGSAAGVKVW